MLRLLLLTIALIVYGSLYPWYFDLSRTHDPLHVLLHAGFGRIDIFFWRDTVINILLYIPLGLTAAAALRPRRSRPVAFAVGFLTGCALSITLELMQAYIPVRVCSIADVLTNAIGSGVGAALAIAFEKTIARGRSYQPRRFDPAAVFLLALFFTYRLFPFYPILSRTHLRLGLSLLLHPPSLSAGEIWMQTAEWFAAAMALEAVFGRLRYFWIILAMFCLPAQWFIAGRILTFDELAGAGLALLLWIFVRETARPGWAVCLLGSSVVLHQLSPFYLLAAPQPFSWIPFHATLMSPRDTAVSIISGKAFDYGVLVWALRKWGAPLPAAGGFVAVALFATELAQQYLPGRTPEITDSVLTLILMLVLWRLGRDNA